MAGVPMYRHITALISVNNLVRILKQLAAISQIEIVAMVRYMDIICDYRKIGLS